MKAKEFGAWPPQNDFKGGQRYSANGYNKSSKQERFPSAQEYANRNLDEYHRFEGTKDLTKEQDVKQSDKKQSDKSRKTENAKSARQRMLQQVVGITVGSTVVVTSYQAQVEERAKQQAFEQIPAIVENIDTELDLQEDILEDLEIPEAVENEQITVSDINNSNSGSGSGSSSGNGGRSGGNTRGNTSVATVAENDNALTDYEQDTDVSEIEESEDSDEISEALPDNQEDDNKDEDITDTDEQNTNPSDDENSENDTAETAPVKENEVIKPSSRTSTSPFWEWNEDNTSVSFVIKTNYGDVVSSTPAIVTAVEDPATCKTDGKITYTATLNEGGAVYTDVQYKDLPALGHSFGSGETITLEGGQKAIRFECTRCHEYFTIKNSILEE